MCDSTDGRHSPKPPTKFWGATENGSESRGPRGVKFSIGSARLISFWATLIEMRSSVCYGDVN